MSGTDDLNTRWKELVKKYMANTCTKKELEELLRLVENKENKEDLSHILKTYWHISHLQSDRQAPDIELKFSLLMQQIKNDEQLYLNGSGRHIWKRLFSYAAAIVIGLLLTRTYFLFTSSPQKQARKTEAVKRRPAEVVPGSNKAVLTLADGAVIILDSSQNGTLTTQGNTKISKLNGTLSYNSSGQTPSTLLYNTISTPKGGQYQVVLADGSRVWLNAASSLRFPAAFTGKLRNVALSGEAYFEVARNEKVPFTVHVNGMEVEVLGTHFNVNSYDNESATRATLLTGSIKINKDHVSRVLQPGQQAQINHSGSLSIINDVNVEEAVAWKDGKFKFDRADIYTVMRQIERWYNVSVEYNGTVSSHFVGAISRHVNLSQVLNMLQLTGKVQFEVRDRNITVIP